MNHFPANFTHCSRNDHLHPTSNHCCWSLNTIPNVVIPKTSVVNPEYPQFLVRSSTQNGGEHRLSSTFPPNNQPKDGHLFNQRDLIGWHRTLQITTTHENNNVPNPVEPDDLVDTSVPTYRFGWPFSAQKIYATGFAHDHRRHSFRRNRHQHPSS